VSGVGPKVALAMLSAMSPDALRLAIGQEQPELLARVPGIGKRTAEKIIFHLKDKIPVEAVPEGLAALTEADTEVIDALTSLGYSIVEAQRAVQSVPREVTEVEERLRMALAYFVRP
jgi:Holliday junction DNA helicase RuvA